MSATRTLTIHPQASRLLFAFLALTTTGLLASACTPEERNYGPSGGAGGASSSNSSSSSSGGGEGGTTSSSSASSSSGAPANPGDIISTQYFPNTGSLLFSLSVDPNGDSLIAGRFTDAINFGDMPLIDMGNSDIFIARHSRDDKLLFSQSYGSAGFGGVVQGNLSPKGNIFLTGDVSDMTSINIGGNVFPGPGVWQVALERLGTPLLYTNMVTAGGNNFISPYGVSSTANDAAVYVGFYGGSVNIQQLTLNSMGDTDGYIFKLDNLGQVAWARSVGGIGHDNVSAISVDANGDNYVAGYFTDSMMLGPGGNGITSVGGSDIFVGKLGPAGAPKWIRRLGGIGEEFIFGTLVVAPNGDVIVASRANDEITVEGIVLPPAGQSDIFIARYATDGTILWAKRYGDAGNQFIESIAVDPNGNILVTGTFDGSIDFGSGPLMGTAQAGMYTGYLAKLDPNGNQIFARTFNGATDGLRIAADGNQSILLAGTATLISFDGGATSFLPTGGIFMARIAP